MIMNSSDILSKHDPFKIMIHHHQKTPSSPFPSPGKVYFLGLMTLSYIVGELTHFLINTTSRYVIIIVIIIIMFVIILVKLSKICGTRNPLWGAVVLPTS